LLNHELLHRWASFFYDLGVSDGHWKAISRPSSGFGTYWGAYKSFVKTSETTSRAGFNMEPSIYSDFELYLMGLAAPGDFAWPIRYLINPTILSLGYDPATQLSYRDIAADGLGGLDLVGIWVLCG